MKAATKIGRFLPETPAETQRCWTRASALGYLIVIPSLLGAAQMAMPDLPVPDVRPVIYEVFTPDRGPIRKTAPLLHPPAAPGTESLAPAPGTGKGDKPVLIADAPHCGLLEVLSRYPDGLIGFGPPRETPEEPIQLEMCVAASDRARAVADCASKGPFLTIGVGSGACGLNDLKARIGASGMVSYALFPQRFDELFSAAYADRDPGKPPELDFDPRVPAGVRPAFPENPAGAAGCADTRRRHYRDAVLSEAMLPRMKPNATVLVALLLASLAPAASAQDLTWAEVRKRIVNPPASALLTGIRLPLPSRETASGVFEGVDILPNVRFRQIRPELVHMIGAARQAWSRRDLGPPTITSGNDSGHAAGSRHYVDRAIDLRTRDLPSGMIPVLARELASGLDPGFRVLLEPDHIHVEYDP